ncbi:MAG TPA: S1 RNA-binding domain-containing protein [Candidatus Paceibacterota bacterium]|nr:S1 RNA-binding domain-containing protein [Candidatus Paceibacterota bacterium]
MTTKPKINPFIKFIKENPDSFAFLKPGDLVEGKILEKSSREVMVDLGKFGTGIIYRGELLGAKNVVKESEVGDTIQAKVVKTNNDEGLVELSLSEAERQKNWLKLNELYEKEEVIKTKPYSANKGGLLTKVENVQAFLPASQLTSENYPDIEDNDPKKIEKELEKLVGKNLEVKIIDANQKSNKLIVSEKAANKMSSKELVKDYEEGQVIEGLVTGIADFGVFIQFTDNPDVEGLIHISELAHRIIDNPKEVVSMDDEIKAKIIEIKDGKISLSLKALEKDPWDEVEERYKEGDKVEGEVYSFNPFGAVIKLDDEIQGQVHVTEFGGEEEMKEKIDKGEDYTFEIKEVNKEDKRINLKFVE